jgi:hypothetical protein
VRLALKVVTLYDWDFTDVILLYFYLKILLYKRAYTQPKGGDTVG